MLRQSSSLGYEAGGGVMVGIPGQSYESLAEDDSAVSRARSRHDRHRAVHRASRHAVGFRRASSAIDPSEQAPSNEQMVYKMIALTRIRVPDANIPSTTALATINKTMDAAGAAGRRECGDAKPHAGSYRRCTRFIPPRLALKRAPPTAINACAARFARSAALPDAARAEEERSRLRATSQSLPDVCLQQFSAVAWHKR
jgi:hypothetical protein